VLYLAWRHGGHDPFRLHHALADDYRQLDLLDSPPVLPSAPRRVRNLVYGFAAFAHNEDVERSVALSGGALKRA